MHPIFPSLPIREPKLSKLLTHALSLAITLGLSISANGAASSPEIANRQLWQLKEHHGDSELSFGAVTELATRLNEEQLVAIAKSVGVGRTHGMRGWVRAAVLAEWGKRDFKAAMTHLSEVSEFDSGHQQALYAVFRGSRPTDPNRALEHLRRMFTEYPSAVGAFTRIWTKHSLKEVFAEMATQQPERTWKTLTKEDANGLERKSLNFFSKKFSRHPLRTIDSKWIAMAGFFSGLKNLEEVETYAAEFKKMWNAPKVVADLKTFNKQFERFTGSMSWTPPPPQEGVARAVAVSMARFDLDVGLDWIVSSGPGTEAYKKRRAGGLFDDWAWWNPNQALAVLRTGKYPRWQENIATVLMRGDAGLAPEVVRLFGKSGWIDQALSGAFPAAATMMVYDMYPSPGEDPVLPSHQARYDSFREAIGAAQLKEKELSEVTRSLNGAFRHTVPAARTAYQLVQRK